MKKSFFLTVAVFLFALVSCQKEILPVNNEVTDPVFKAGIVATRTTVNSLSGKISWEEGDEVSITDASSVTVTYVASDVNGGLATLTKKVGESGTLGSGPYTAVYGTAPSVSQTYSAQTPSLPMSAVSNNDTFNFRVTCGLLELTLTKDDESIKSIAVSDGTTTYTLTCDQAVSIAEGNKFYLVLPAADYTTFTFTNASDVECVLEKAGAKITVSNNTISPVSFASTLDFIKTYPEGTLDGVFSVGPDKQVRFSKGNLQYQASTGTWRFAARQHDFIGKNPGNTTAENRNTQTDWIDLFGWGATGMTSINGYLKCPYETDTSEGHYKTKETNKSDETLSMDNGGDWGVCMGEGWRLLSKDEWGYLLGGNNSIPQRTNASSLCITCRIEIASATYVYGLVVMPDEWSGSKLTGTISLARWAELEAAGGVFFPSAGRRDGTSVANAPGCEDKLTGYYWSSTASTDKNAYEMLIKSDYQGIISQGSLPRSYGLSVRLVVDN